MAFSVATLHISTGKFFCRARTLVDYPELHRRFEM